MSKKIRISRASLLLGLFSVGLIGFRLWCAWTRGLLVETQFPTDWVQLYSAQQLIQGHWLGLPESLVLILPPGYSIWIALNYLIGIPISLGSEMLLISGALVFLWALKKMAVPHLICGFLLAVLLLDPVSQSLYRRVTSTTLTLPLILWISSGYFLSIYQERKWKKVLWIVVGTALALYWISFSRHWVPIAMTVWMVCWELSLQPPGHFWRLKLLWILPMILAMTVPVLLADLSIRTINELKYGQFTLQKKNGIIPGPDQIKGISAPKNLFHEVGEASSGERAFFYEVRGWAASNKSPMLKAVLLDAQGNTIGETSNFGDRLDVHSFLKNEIKWETPPLKSGFTVRSKTGKSVPKPSKITFFSKSGQRIDAPLESRGGIEPDFVFTLDSIETKFPGQSIQDEIFRYAHEGQALLLEFLKFSAVLAVFLIVWSKFLGAPQSPIDYWLVQFSIILVFLLMKAIGGNLRDYSLTRPIAWPLATIFCCQGLLLLREARRALKVISEGPRE